MKTTMTYEEQCRRKAMKLLHDIDVAKNLMASHKLSVGYVGEHLLMNKLSQMLPKEYRVGQGFVINMEDESLSNQCDIIIYQKTPSAIYKAFGNIKIIKSDYVCAVIEVKSSIQKKTFYSTLDAFRRLSSMRITNTFLFCYGMLSRTSIVKWFASYRTKNMDGDIIVLDTDLYDWPDKEWLPNTIISLECDSLFSIEISPYDNGDWFGYTSYIIEDKENRKIGCLQEFFVNILRLLKADVPRVNAQSYSVDSGIPLFRI